MVRLEHLPPLGCPYNLSAAEYWSVVPPDERPEQDEEGEFVWSVASLPPSGSQEQERRRLFLALSSLIRNYLDQAGIPQRNEDGEEVFGEYSVGQFPSDREMRFFIDHPRAFTPELVRRLQTLLAAEFPLWRVVPQFNKLIMGVYPDGVRFDDFVDRVPFRDDVVHGVLEDHDPLFSAWLNRVDELDKQLRRDRRQGST